MRLRSFLRGCMGLLVGFGLATSALAQTGARSSRVPASGFFVGAGGSFNSVNVGQQDVYAVGTSDVYDSSGTLVQTGRADGPAAPIYMDSQTTLAPSFQIGYFQHFTNSDWLWGAKFGYSYLDSTATTRNALIPQFGSFTTVSSGAVTAFTGNAYVSYAQTTLVQQMALIPFIGHALGNGFVYGGAGPTLSQLRTDLNGLVGFADINGNHTDVSGAPQNFSGTNWVYGFAATIGLTYFLDDSWFLDASYTYAQTQNQTADFSSTFSNPNGTNGTTLNGTLNGNSTWDATTQSVTVTINKLF